MDAYSSASRLCEEEYLDRPPLLATAQDTTDSNADTKDIVTAVIVPSHLQHILFEVFKVSENMELFANHIH